MGGCLSRPWGAAGGCPPDGLLLLVIVGLQGHGLGIRSPITTTAALTATTITVLQQVAAPGGHALAGDEHSIDGMEHGLRRVVLGEVGPGGW